MILEPNQKDRAIRNLIWLKGRKFQKYNLLKFRVICAIMDYMAIMNGVRTPNKQYGLEVFPEQDIDELLTKYDIINLKSKGGRADYNSIIGEMKLIGLIEGNGGFIRMTQYMVDSYQKQTFHQILASLMAAEDSRTLSLRTLWISVLAVIMASVAICLK